jgi:ferredoxin
MKAIYERYHIEVKEAPSKIKLPSKFIVKRYNNCVNVQECTQACIYEVHKIQEDGQIAEPDEDLCRGCHQCALACPKGAISIGINPEFEKLGNSYFTPDRIKTIYFEAETGRVPVSGTGYKGPFAGRGFDSMWFDFSEIVRPTRDGIHGREYISTSVDLGRKLSCLEFDENGELLSSVPKIVEIPIPMILDAPLASRIERNLQLALAKAAARLNTFAVVNAEEYSADLLPYKSNLIPRIDSDKVEEFEDLIQISRIVEVDCKDSKIKDHLKRIKAKNPSVLVSMRFPYDEKSGEKAEAITKTGSDIAHFYVDDEVVEQDPDVIKRVISSVHSYLVDKNIRDEITLISSGGIAEAAHVSKSIILGADAVTVGLAYQIALGCKVCYGDKHAKDCLMKVEDKDIEWAAQRIINLMGAWRDQLLEVLGGMGLREVRRQRGEIGRAMFYENLEAKIFGDEE